MEKFVWKARFGKASVEDLSLSLHDRTEVVTKIFLKRWEAQKKKSCLKPSLISALLKCFAWDFFIAGVYKFIWSVLICLCAFYFVRELTAFVGNPEPAYHGWLLCVGFLVGCLVLSFSFQQMSSKATQVGIRMRGALLQAVYEKSLRLDLQDLVAGDVVNLATNDCSRLMESCLSFHYLWSGVLESLGIVGLLIYLVGYTGFIALGIIIVLIVVQCIFGFLVAHLRAKNINTTDARVSLMTEILMAIKLVKLYAWEDFFAKHVKKIRRKEVALMAGGATIKTINLMIVFGVPPLIALAIFAVYVSTVGPLSATTAFTTLSLFNTLRFPLVVLPKALRGFAEFIAALSRLQAFLLKEEMTVYPKDPNYRGVMMENASFSYLHTENMLHDLTFEIPNGKLCGMIGLVGTGKSNLVYSILGQMKLTKGEFKVGGKIGYVPQTPWIQNGTIRDNILFGLPYEEERYKQTVYACAMVRDFEIMADGDLTVLSDRGQNLSGGQKQRIALARAAYSNADFYILDSPLSAVDMHTCKHIFDHCIRGMMRGKSVLLITHHLELLPDCDLVSVMDEGKMKYFGEWNNDCVDILKQYFTSWEYDPEQHGKKKVDDFTDTPAMILTGTEDPLVPQTVTDSQSELDTYSLANSMSTTSADNLLPVSTSTPEKQDELAIPADAVPIPTVKDEGVPKSKVPFKGHLVWYFENGVILVPIAIFIFAITQASRIVSDKFISWWTSDRYGFSQNKYIWIYGLQVAIFLVLLILRGLFFYVMTLRATTRLHNRMFKKVLRAPMLFYNETPVGRVLACFSKDQDTADEGLPDSIHMTLIYLMILLTSVIIVCVSLPYYTVVLALLIGSFVIFYGLYAAPAQFLKEEIGATNSDMFAHLNESLTGLPVIRAFEVENTFEKLTIQKINSNHRALFMSEMLQLWLSFRLDIVSSFLVFITAIFAVAGSGLTDPSSFGLAISNSFQMLVFFTWVVRGFAEINSQIACYERINFYARNTASEKPAHIKATEPAKNWPTTGAVEIKQLVLRYSPKLDPVLKGVSISIKGGEKIGVVGRTGSGKTTLLMSLFRLIEPDSGDIYIDGVDVMKMGLTDLRKRIAIIPQEPVLFKGTIRTNLDPFGQYEDRQIWNALECANLKTVVDEMPDKLETKVLENGSNYSLGQKQLVCLARAVLNQSKLLVFDEATASMDSQTDSEIQGTIRRVFADRTILTIAHRLETIIDSDRILLMDAGRVLEFDTPANLLSDPNGSFTKLVEQSGPEASASLKKIAFAKAASLVDQTSLSTNSVQVIMHDDGDE
jgi:ATP-binding cassette subfamily C (CFTR/MRP) protein 1